MNLPSGTYTVLMLYAKRHRAEQRSYTLEFVLLETGERGRAIVRYKDMVPVFGPAAFIMRDGGIWGPADIQSDRPEMRLTLEYSAKWDRTRAVSAARTGRLIPCDIKPPEKQGYEEF